MDNPSHPIPYTTKQIERGVSRSEVVDNQASNNVLWSKDRAKLTSLQNYIRTLQEKGIISK
jgi:hypothetical protein